MVILVDMEKCIFKNIKVKKAVLIFLPPCIKFQKKEIPHSNVSIPEVFTEKNENDRYTGTVEMIREEFIENLSKHLHKIEMNTR